MVPLRSAALTGMCDTILASVDRHWSLRSNEVTPLYVNLGAPVLVLCAACYFLTVRAASRVLVMQIVWHALV